MAKGTQELQREYGAGNLLVDDTPEKVTITFDPRVIIGRFNPSAKLLAAFRGDETGKVAEPQGNPKVASTGSYRILDISGVRVMLHVIGRSDS